MLLGNRQAKFGLANVPPIEFSNELDVSGYDSIIEVFTEALVKKMGVAFKSLESPHSLRMQKYYKEANDREIKIFKTCLEQTVTFLNWIAALKPAPKISKIILWKKSVQLPPFYEGINAQLNSTMVKHLYPSTAEALDKGATYASYNLTQISEAIIYVMEYFQKEKILKVPEDVDKKRVAEWIEKHNDYYEKNKKEIKLKNKKRAQYRKDEIEQLNKSIAMLGNFGNTIDKIKQKSVTGMQPISKQPRPKFPKTPKPNFNRGRMLR